MIVYFDAIKDDETIFKSMSESEKVKKQKSNKIIEFYFK